MRRNKQTEVPESPSWDDIFKNVPIAPGTEAQQARHKELRQTRGDEMTEVEEQELNNLFYAIYPQFAPKK